MKLKYLLVFVILIFHINCSGNAIKQEPIIEKFTYQGDSSSSISGTLYIPKGSVKKMLVILNAVIYDGVEHPNFTLSDDTLSYDRFVIQHFLDQQIGTLLINTEKSIDPRYPLQTLSSYAKDAESAVKYLKSQDRFKQVPIGLWGASAAGCSAAISASNNTDISFLILVSVPGTDGATLDQYYFTSPVCNNLMLLGLIGPLMQAIPDSTFMYDKEPFPKDKFIFKMVDAYDKINREILSNNHNIDSIHSQAGSLLRNLFEGNNFKDVNMRPYGGNISASQYMDSIAKYQYVPYTIEQIQWNPEKVYPTISCPTIMLFGSDDVNINLDASVKETNNIIKNNRLNNFTIKYYEGLNHGLLPSDPNSVKGVPTEVFNDIFVWMNKI